MVRGKRKREGALSKKMTSHAPNFSVLSFPEFEFAEFDQVFGEYHYFPITISITSSS